MFSVLSFLYKTTIIVLYLSLLDRLWSRIENLGKHKCTDVCTSSNDSVTPFSTPTPTYIKLLSSSPSSS